MILPTGVPVLPFVFVLTFLILIHELGHFFAALLCKVHIEEFGIGLPPKAITLFRWKGIPFTLNWLFLGGFVRMEGEDQLTQETQQSAKPKNSPIQTYPFYARPLWQKLLIVFAGPAVNILFGILVFSGLYSYYGIPQQEQIPVTITEVAPNSPAQKAGLAVGDVITSVSVSGTKSVSTSKEFISVINENRGSTITLSINRAGTSLTLPVYVRKTEEIPAGEGSIGVAVSDTKTRMQFYPGLEQLYRASLYGIQTSFEFAKTVLTAVAGIGASIAHLKLPAEVAGPVGIAHEVEKEGIFAKDFATALNFAALLSLNLGVMNLLPIPALDGGRFVLLILERFVKHKKFAAVEQNLNQFGFLLLIGLLLLITVKDVIGIVFSK